MTVTPESSRRAARRARREAAAADAGFDTTSASGDAEAAAALFHTDTDAVTIVDPAPLNEFDADAVPDAVDPDAVDTDAADARDAVAADAADAPDPARVQPTVHTSGLDDLTLALFPERAEPPAASAPASGSGPAADSAGGSESTASSGSAPASAPEAAQEPAPEAPREWADEKRPATALTWLDGATLTSAPMAQTTPDLFAGARTSRRRARVILPLVIVAALCGSYVGSTLLWPLDAVAPTVQGTQVEIADAPAASITWPAEGSAAIGIQGLAPVASTTEQAPIASITKVVSAMMVLDALPLAVGEQGPSYSFTRQDSREFWRYRYANQSSLDVPVDGSLTEYQMLQGILLGSANNYIDRLSDEIWGSDRAFAEAAEKWLDAHGIEDVELKSPSGFNDRNVASPAALIQIGEIAMAHPVFAEIVGTKAVDLPGAGHVTNSNQMLEDPGVVGVKTGTLRDDWNLLTAKDVDTGKTTVRVFTVVLGQEGGPERLAETRALLAQVEKSLAEQPVSVPKGTVVGHVSTEWGERVDVVTDEDVRVVLWNGTGAKASTEWTLDEQTESGATVGTLTAEGPLDTAQTTVSLADEVTPPSIWWRLTHPLELFGLDKG